MVRGSEFGGMTTLGIEVTEVVRVANAPLLTSEANEVGRLGGSACPASTR